jgi:hypothetical protein
MHGAVDEQTVELDGPRVDVGDGDGGAHS